MTIVWNWHWNCPDDAPPPAAVTGTTLCVGCNIAISVRVSSPGDSGGVTQTTGTDVSSVAAGVAAAAQAAAQVLPEAAPQQPAVPPPAPPLPPAEGTPTPPEAPVVTVAISTAAQTGSAETLAAEDLPRHGPPDFTTAPSRTAPRAATSLIQVRAAVGAAAVRTIAVPRIETIGRAGARSSRSRDSVRHADHRQHALGLHTPRPFPPAPPRTPTPLGIAPALTETHDAGSITGFALGAGGLGMFLLVFLGYAAPGLQTARSLPVRAHPDPPG